MGSSSSKVARGAARKYPTRAPGSAIPAAAPRRQPIAKSKAEPLGDGIKDDAIRADSMDPDFAPGDFSRRLHSMGIADPNPTYSPSSTAAYNLGPQNNMRAAFPPSLFNPTLSALAARQRFQQEAEQDFESMGRANTQGRRFLDMRTMVDAMKLRGHGVADKDIEAKLRIRPGLLERLGPQGVLSHVTNYYKTPECKAVEFNPADISVCDR
ncbi:hypothetical protein G7Z17_g5092 [Cylindrodendrum hubeiense]|uniref:Helix-turn-helix domain-containing protein n=1 Tax=Cylindrodendrum hubeiense TaxID=595255 RepID=A0A9P5LC14_9HYPO|nr:hypothetical protein G7Z17_g5092 [Cylindrodendrum hubeiense]